jgi:hypothetical protein
MYYSGSSNLTKIPVIKPESAESLFYMIQSHFHPYDQPPLRHVALHYSDIKTMGWDRVWRQGIDSVSHGHQTSDACWFSWFVDAPPRGGWYFYTGVKWMELEADH